MQFEISEPLVAAWYCHCTRCQRRTGAAASVNALAAPGAFGIVAGEESLRVWSPTDGREKWFCGKCGSALFASGEGRAEPIGIRMGAFDRDPEIRPSARVFVDNAAPWEPIPDDGLAVYGENPN